MVGYYKPRCSKGVIDPLFARGILFESSQGKGVILTLDICLITKDLATEIRQMIANVDDYREAACHARYMGRVIAGQILTICDKMEEIGKGGLRFGSVEMQFPTNKDSEGLEEAKMVNELYLAGRKNEIPKTCMSVVKARRILKMQNAPLFYTYFAYVLRIGDFIFAGLPGEPFTEIGRRIYDNSPFRHMMLCCQTNAACGYLGTSEAYDEGGYETTASVYKKGVDDIVVNSMTELLKKVF